MIKDYFRPKTLGEASEILKKNPLAIPIGGGTSVNQLENDVVVVDLQDLNLKFIKKVGLNFQIGSGTTLEQLGSYFAENVSLIRALKIDGTKNQRNQASIAGFIKLATGRSALLTCLLTLDVLVTFADDKNGIPLIDFLKKRNSSNKIITQLSIEDPAGLLFESVSRSPLDLPIVCCAIKANGAVGGFGTVPQMVPNEFFNGNGKLDISNFIHFDDDEWASGDYRKNVAQIILNRLFKAKKKGN